MAQSRPRKQPAIIYPEFGAWFLATATEQGWSKRRIALALGVAPETCGRWGRGEARPKPGMCQALADCFGISVDVVWEKAGYRDRMQGEDGPEVSTLITQIKKIDWNPPESQLAYDSLLAMLKVIGKKHKANPLRIVTDENTGIDG